MITVFNSVGVMGVRECPKCGARLFEGEDEGMCCSKGKIKLRPLNPVTDEVKEYFDGLSRVSKNFLNHIRQYNCKFAFTSLGTSNQPVPGRGPPTFKISGRMHHLMGQLLPPAGQSPVFAQVYIHDEDEQLRLRLNEASHLNEAIIGFWNRLMTLNPFAQRFRQIGLENRPDMRYIIKERVGDDRRRYNAPSSDEIAILMPGDGSQETHFRDVILSAQGGNLQRINEMNPHYDPLHYPLLFPMGDFGWADDLQQFGTQRKVTLKQFYAYRIMERSDEYSCLHRAKRLFQEYLVDQYAKIETSRLDFLRNNQATIRAELYQGVVDAVQDGVQDMSNLGKKIILPASFDGSPRDMSAKYQDAMAICKEFGKPTFFITFTANPNWDEVKNSLLPGQTPADRPDVVARVFHLKLKILMKILKDGVLGESVAYCSTIEFQKRGLPHVHILFITSQQDCPKTPDEVDRVISAELPDSDTDPELYEIVGTTMLHGPCGADHPNARCMINGKCSKGFPKSFCEVTTIGNDSYPEYKRSNNGRFYIKNGFTYDNRWVVPHNNDFCKAFNSHINVECVSSVKAIKYIYKYAYKGHDRATVQEENRNEIQRFQDCRYIGSSEAVWRILGFSMHDKSHAVEMMPVHLENMHMVFFRATDQVENIVSSEKRSKLEAWFAFNFANPNSPLKDLLYTKFAKECRWDGKNSQWIKRKNVIKVIGRCPFVSPTDHERFALRILLHHVPGATSFAYLKTYEQVEYPTFQAACVARGLLNDEVEFLNCLREAAQSSSSKQLRSLMVTILAYNCPGNVMTLWNEMKDEFINDFTLNMSEEDATSMALKDIDDQLQKVGSSINHFDLPRYQLTVANRSKLITEHKSFCLESRGKPDCSNLMTAEQLEFYQSVLDAIDLEKETPTSKLFFLDAPAGYGKTFVENALIHKVRSMGKIVLAVASSGIASLLLPHGTTAHSQFKIPINLSNTSTCSVSAQSDLASLLKEADMICWDEAPMHHKLGYEAVQRTLQDLTGLNEFGGKVVIFSGDFRQTLPVIPKGSRSAIVSSSLSRCSFWERVRRYRFTKNMRLQSTDEQDQERVQKFSEWLLDIGNGLINEVPISDDYLVQGGSSVLIDKIYPSLEENIGQCAILAATNLSVDAINNQVLQRIPGNIRSYYSCDEAVNDSAAYPVDFLNQLNISGLPPHDLQLKLGAIVMLLRNLNPSKGLMNGTRMKILQLMDRVIKVEILTGANVGSVHFIPRIKLIPSDSTLPFDMSRMQFPIKLAYAMTINKAQGQSLNRVGLYLDNQVFSHGQLYVALSRATSPDRVSILIPNGDSCARNIVFTEALV
jgi:hypothetical protein